jgi:hypothetical protein
LEYVELVPDDRYNAEHIDRDALITAIKAALEEPEEKYIYGTPLLDAMTGRSHTPEDVKKMMEPWSPVSIGVDVTKEGAHVVGIYALDADTSQIFYAKHHPVPQRTWVGLTDEHKEGLIYMTDPNPEPHHLRELIDVVEFQLKEKNT